ncbi:MAG: hypothetical protein Q8K66_12745 [Sediminibacterium sp.]|nr:hypothetical protein [Sediminibacterium sp.]MDP3128899.1 hypothetical protein [Sediminibacterium sp.]
MKRMQVFARFLFCSYAGKPSPESITLKEYHSGVDGGIASGSIKK